MSLSELFLKNDSTKLNVAKPRISDGMKQSLVNTHGDGAIQRATKQDQDHGVTGIEDILKVFF